VIYLGYLPTYLPTQNRIYTKRTEPIQYSGLTVFPASKVKFNFELQHHQSPAMKENLTRNKRLNTQFILKELTGKGHYIDEII
jgi:hypothetical protein